MRILILAGRGRFSDLWHDAAATSHEIALALEPHDAVIRSTFLDSLDDLADFDLLVLNISRPLPGYAAGDGADADWAAFIDRIVNWAKQGGSILAVHQTALAAEAYPQLAEIIGGHWVEGVSGHPEISELTVHLTDNNGMVDSGIVETFDEDYQRLFIDPAVVPLGFVGDSPEPIIWLYSGHGGRTIYSALGHDARSYTPSHCAMLREFATYLTRDNWPQGVTAGAPSGI